MSSTLSNLLYHIVYSTKYREPLITTFRTELYKYISSTIIREGGRILCVNGVSDHIHIAAKLLPRHSISNIVQIVKGNSSKWINEQCFCAKHFSWQVGYGAFSFGKYGIDTVIRYIKSQEEHHRKKTFKEEFIKMLNLHGIEYDEKYLWD